ncbi:MAG: hypothetical protein M1827_000388 [Pycnora praestabilis]|nr:MAG: hypothetical protein M1827_000388 [Pycnora praestabilis]
MGPDGSPSRGEGQRSSELQPRIEEDYEFTSPTEATTEPLVELVDTESALPIPRWAEEPSPRWQWLPISLQKITQITVNWVEGPRPPRIQKVAPFFPSIQTAPPRFLDHVLPKRKHKTSLFMGFYLCWLLAFVLLLHRSANSGKISGYGMPTEISCFASYWNGGNGCGLNGNNCRPFSNSSFAFRCPANCASVQVLNPRAVGAQEVVYQQYVIGGSTGNELGLASDPIYRGDSFVCQAAIHAGMVNNEDGGCGVVSLVGGQSNFVSTFRNGIKSVGFDSTFPLSFTFIPGTSSECKDLRWPLLAISVTFTCVLSLFITSPAIFFASIFTSMFFHVGLASDPPNFGDYYSISSVIVGRFLPAAFVAFVLYRYCVRPQLSGLTAQVEKTVLWLGGCWVGALNNYTFDLIPISRLTPHDIQQQPGAKVALLVIVLILFFVIIGQIFFLQLEGRLPRFLALYASMAISIGLLVAIPGLNLRIHHYFLAILLLPGTGIQTRPSLLYQGILVGLFINGIARWGFDSILQTSAELLGDGQIGSVLPSIVAPLITSTNISFAWMSPPRPYDGISILVNDVERYRGYQGYDDPLFTWGREKEGQREYFRFGYMSGSDTGDYTKAGTWEADGKWTQMRSGPSR